MVISTINNFIDMINNIDDKIDKLFIESNSEYENNLKKIKLVELDKEIQKYNKFLDDLLDDYNENIILKEDFEKYNQEYLYELNRLNIEREKIKKNNNILSDYTWIKRIKDNGKIISLNRNVLSNFINNIYIYEDGSVEIDLKYNSQYENVLKSLKYVKNMI